MNFTKTALIVAALVLVSGCGKEPEATPNSAGAEASAQSMPAASAPKVPVDNLTINVIKDGIPSVKGIGAPKDEGLHTTGGTGYLIFGPYQPFIAGDYVIKFDGSVSAVAPNTEILVDVVGNKGSEVFAKNSVKAPGDFPEMTFSLPSEIKDLEVRILVPLQSDAQINGYTISKK